MRTTGRLWRLLSVLFALTFIAAACGDDDSTSATTTSGGGEATTTTAGGTTAGALAGMRGQYPATKLSDDFVNRLKSVDPNLSDFTYADSSYDAVVIITLASMIAGSDGIEHASEINGVTRGGTKCDSFEACKALIDGGTTDIDYDGVSGPGEFSGNGEPTKASYGVFTFGDDNRFDGLNPDKYVDAEAPASADVAPVPVEGTRAGDGVLKIGTLLPETGDLAFLGPPEIAGVQLAVNDINAAGGYNGQDVQIDKGDSGDADPDVANPTVDRLLAENVDAVVGAAASGITLNVIDKITGAGVTMFSPANTSKRLSDYPDKGLYFRTAPSDILQGQVMGELIAEDGHTTIAIVNRDDAYGNGLAEDLTASFEAAGGEVLDTITYDPENLNAEDVVDNLVGLDADAIALITFEEGSLILAKMVELGVGPATNGVYGCDGNMSNSLGENFEAGK